MSGELLAVYPDGRSKRIDNDYESIKAALNGATIDLVRMPAGGGLFIDDNGMIEGLTLNVPACVFTGLCLYGPVVLVGDPDEEGEALPAATSLANAFMSMANVWQCVCMDAIRKGQRILTQADPDTVPPAEIIEMDEEQFEQFLKGEWP